MKLFNNLPTAFKLIMGFGIVTLLLIVISVIGYIDMKEINDFLGTMYFDRAQPIEQSGRILQDLSTIRGDIYKYILMPEERKTLSEDIATTTMAVNENLANFKNGTLDETEKEHLAKFETAWKEYYNWTEIILEQIDSGHTTTAMKGLAEGGGIDVARKSATEAMDNLVTTNNNLAKDLITQAGGTFTQSKWISISTSVFAVMIAILLTWVITISFNKPLKLIAFALESTAKGDLYRSISQEDRDLVLKRTDEIGRAGKGLGGTRVYLTEMAEAAEKIASGDLTITVTPKCETDELGNSFAKMITGLRTSVTQVADNAESVGTAAEQLSLAANQAGEATNQISITIQQVAGGTSQQTDSVSKTAASIDHLSRAIDGVAKGAQDQANAINQTSTAMQQLSAAVKEIRSGAQEQVRALSENKAALEQFSESVEKLNQGAQSQAEGLGQAAVAGENLNQAIQEVATAAVEVSNQVQEAAEAAQRGSSIVSQTTEGMQKVREATNTLAERVQGLGQRSGEIGAIVSTIDDIASQTNLLALNAAIEAARAGEHGKGFAVVADEVRKLAEKSAVATREIGELVKTVQKGAGEAVVAMQQAGVDVSAASDYTRQASDAFEAIVNGTVASAGGFSAIQQAIQDMEMARGSLERSIEDARRIATENRDYGEEMENLNKAIVTRLEREQRVAESNATTADEMARLNEVVIEQLDNTSAIVEENTAAAEEMGASAGEVSVMVENIASISEENSASTEEVSASTEEMSAQVEEVTASASALAEMAQDLKRTVAQFKI